MTHGKLIWIFWQQNAIWITQCPFHAFSVRFLVICTTEQDEPFFCMEAFPKCRLGVYGGKRVRRSIVYAHGPVGTQGHRRPSYLLNTFHSRTRHPVRCSGFEWKSRELRHRRYRRDLSLGGNLKLNKITFCAF